MIGTALTSPLIHSAGFSSPPTRDEASPKEGTVTIGTPEEPKTPTFAEMLKLVGTGEERPLDLEALGETRNVDLMVEMERMQALRRQAEMEAWLDRLRERHNALDHVWRV